MAKYLTYIPLRPTLIWGALNRLANILSPPTRLHVTVFDIIPKRCQPITTKPGSSQQTSAGNFSRKNKAQYTPQLQNNILSIAILNSLHGKSQSPKEQITNKYN